MGWLRQTRAKMLAAALYALAVVTLGFAHQPIGAKGPAQAEFAAYALPDGTLPVICGHDDSGAPAGPIASAAHCDACALAAAPGLPPPPASALAPPLSRKVAFVATPAFLLPPPPIHAPAARGPPLA